MSYTKQTPNLGLPQYVADDKPSWLEDINGAFSSVDTFAGQATGDIANAAGAAAEAKEAAANASNAVTQVVEKQDEIDGEVERLGSDLNLTKQAVEDNTAAIEELQTGGGAFNPIIPQGDIPHEYVGVSLDFIRGKADTMSSYLVRTEEILVEAGKEPFNPMPDEFVLVVIPGATNSPDKGVVQMVYDVASQRGRYRTLGVVWSGWVQMDDEQVKKDIASIQSSIVSIGGVVMQNKGAIADINLNRVYCSYTKIPELEITTDMSIKQICQKLITGVGTGGSQTKSVTVHLWCNTSTAWGNEIREVFPSVYGELSFFANGRNVWLSFRPYEQQSGGGNVYPVAYNSYTNENNFDRMSTWVVLKDWSQKIADIEGDVAALEADVAGIQNNYLGEKPIGWKSSIVKTGADGGNHGIALDVVDPYGNRSRLETSTEYMWGTQSFWYTASDDTWHQFQCGTSGHPNERVLYGQFFINEESSDDIILRSLVPKSDGMYSYDLHIGNDGFKFYKANPGQPYQIIWSK